MQRTRLNTLVDVTGTRITEFFGNPWRRISLILVSLLFGFFIGSAIPSTLGQSGKWDVVASASVFLFTEIVNRWVYSRKQVLSLWIDVLNMFKIGVTYSLFLEAFKLGS